MMHPREDSMESLNELLVRLKYIDAANPVRCGSCLCQGVTCGYYAWKRRFQVGKQNSAPAADPHEASSLGRRPRALWDTPYNAHTDGVSPHRCLTPLHVVTTLLCNVAIPPSTIVLDCCGGANDAIAVALRAHGCDVICNDSVPCRVADYHLNAASTSFVDTFTGTVVDWVVSSPPYDDSAVQIIQNAINVARRGVCMKVRLSFLEPCASRREFLSKHPVSLCLVLPRVTYGSRRSSAPECWLVWNKDVAYPQTIVYG